MRIIFKHVKNLSENEDEVFFPCFLYKPMMKVSMGKYSVHPSTHRAKLGHAALLNADPAGEVLVAVQEAGRPVQRVSGVIYSWTLFWCFVRGTEEYPLFSSCHLSTGLWLTFCLQFYCKTIKLHAELTEVFILPHTLVLRLRGEENQVNI